MLQVVAQKVCHGCTLEKEAQHFMPDRRSKDGLMNYCRDCCQAGNTSAAVIPRRPGRPPRTANLIPLTEKVTACADRGMQFPAQIDFAGQGRQAAIEPTSVRLASKHPCFILQSVSSC